MPIRRTGMVLEATIEFAHAIDELNDAWANNMTVTEGHYQQACHALGLQARTRRDHKGGEGHEERDKSHTLVGIDPTLTFEEYCDMVIDN